MSDSLFTIGHSNHPIEQFLFLLKGCGITAVADVRSQPYSRHYPQYSQGALKISLQEAGIAYVFLGRIGSEVNPACYRQGR